MILFWDSVGRNGNKGEMGEFTRINDHCKVETSPLCYLKAKLQLNCQVCYDCKNDNIRTVPPHKFNKYLPNTSINYNKVPIGSMHIVKCVYKFREDCQSVKWE